MGVYKQAEENIILKIKNNVCKMQIAASKKSSFQWFLLRIYSTDYGSKENGCDILRVGPLKEQLN
jgi:hypothetical protein